jgi:ubiquinone/menaquinone biosynthesis C-methylase UbiE
MAEINSIIHMRTEVTYFNDLSKAYLGWYSDETPEGYSFRMRREKVLAMIPQDGSGKHLLDLACGPGIMFKGLRARNYRVTGIDAAPEMIELAKKEAGTDTMIECAVGDAYALSVPDKQYDIVTAMGLIEYLDDEEKYMKETNRILKDGGTAIITYPNVWSPWRIWNRILRFIARPGKKPLLIHREYTVARTFEQFRAHGFEPTRVMYYNFKLIPFPIDRFFPRFTVWTSKIFEHLDRTPFGFLATAFIVEATKRESK